jgi:predicted TIM-barrel fold metal-dependent hydrolase
MKEERDLFLHEYHPLSHLEVKETPISKPPFPVIDCHNHFMDPFGGGWDKKPLSLLLEKLDEVEIKEFWDLDGGWGENILQTHLDHFKSPVPEIFRIFGGIDWSKWAEHPHNFGEWAASRLREQARIGAEGLKIWKNFGLHLTDPDGKLISIDDKRLDPIFEAAGELHFPVLMHIADPIAFFDPLDSNNERWEELHENPDWHFPSPPFPAFHQLLNNFKTRVKRHLNTKFIGAHMGCYSENLTWVGQMLDECPNYYVDIAARISELGRQPYTSKRFFEKYRDRILFGIDVGPDIKSYQTYFRFLQTDDEYFNYSGSEIPSQGRWYIYGLKLPDEILKKVYFENAEKIMKARK